MSKHRTKSAKSSSTSNTATPCWNETPSRRTTAGKTLKERATVLPTPTAILFVERQKQRHNSGRCQLNPLTPETVATGKSSGRHATLSANCNASKEKTNSSTTPSIARSRSRSRRRLPAPTKSCSSREWRLLKSHFAFIPRWTCTAWKTTEGTTSPCLRLAALTVTDGCISLIYGEHDLRPLRSLHISSTFM